MNFLTSILVVLASSGTATMAATPTNGYHLKLQLALKGTPVSAPEIIVKKGEQASITQGSANQQTFIEVIANEGTAGTNKGILMKFVVGSIDKNGHRTIISKPQILAIANQKAEISISEKDGPEDLSLSVIATPKTL